jgi:hypothetical protein
MLSITGFMLEMVYVILVIVDVGDDLSMEALFTFLQMLSCKNRSLEWDLEADGDLFRA